MVDEALSRRYLEGGSAALKVWTEEEILAHYDGMQRVRDRAPIQLIDPRDERELKLLYSQLPASLRKDADAISEAMIFNFISKTAFVSVKAYDDTMKTLEEMKSEFGENSSYYQIQKSVITLPHTAKPTALERRIASMREDTFHSHFDAFKAALQYSVYVITNMTTGDRYIRINLTLDDCYKAVNAIYHNPSQKDKAASEGIVTDIGSNTYIITDKEYMNALSPYHQDAGAHVVGNLPAAIEGVENVEDLFDADGKATDAGVRIFEMKKGAFTPFTGDRWFLNTNYKILADLYRENPDIINNGCIYRVSRAALCKHLGIRTSNRTRSFKGSKEGDQQAAKRIDLIEEAGQFVDHIDIKQRYEECSKAIGVMPNGSYYAMFTFRGYDKDTDSYELSSPFLAHVAQGVAANREKNARGRQKYNPNFGHSDLIHGNIQLCKNESAKSILEYLIRTMQQQGDFGQEGEKGSKRVKHSVSCATIIDNLPDVQARIDSKIRIGDKNVVLRRAFTGVIDTGTDGKEKKNLFREYTDAYTFFDDLKISWAIPTMQTLKDTKITITWKPQKEAADPVIVVNEKPKRKKKKATE